jgi:hypothetical protein
VPYQVELENDLFEPKFVYLMDDDKKHLIVAFLYGGKAFRVLAVQDFFELDVVRVIKV